MLICFVSLDANDLSISDGGGFLTIPIHGSARIYHLFIDVVFQICCIHYHVYTSVVNVYLFAIVCWFSYCSIIYFLRHVSLQPFIYVIFIS